MKIATLLISCVISFSCAASSDSTPRPAAQPAANPTTLGTTDVSAKAAEPQVTPETSGNEPKTVLDFFNVLPEKYFSLEGCDRFADKDCKKARAEYLMAFTEVADIKNGYFKGGCDGAQSCIEMAIFKRPAASYLVGVLTSGEMINDFYFLDFAGGKWNDASSEVPEFSSKNWYELPRVGTTMKVFEKKVIEKGDDYEVTEKGRKLYDLVWKDGKFTKK